MTDETLISGCIKKNTLAQKALYEKYSPKMLAVCFRFANNKQDAEDMLQDGFIKVFLEIKAYEGRGSFEGWIRRIVVHTCINHLKKNKHFNESVDVVYASGLKISEDNVSASIYVKQVNDCIRTLPVGYRTVLNLFAIEGYTHREIAKMLEIEEGTSRSQYTRAKKMLEGILIEKNILQPPKQNDNWLAVVGE